ncbi:MAG: hypothetical protein ACTSUE_07625 [Promethearchaeota archaeon]
MYQKDEDWQQLKDAMDEKTTSLEIQMILEKLWYRCHEDIFYMRVVPCLLLEDDAKIMSKLNKYL